MDSGEAVIDMAIAAHRRLTGWRRKVAKVTAPSVKPCIELRALRYGPSKGANAGSAKSADSQTAAANGTNGTNGIGTTSGENCGDHDAAEREVMAKHGARSAEAMALQRLTRAILGRLRIC